VILDDLPERVLDQAELAALVARIADWPETWSGQAAVAGRGRHYACLHRDHFVDVWLIGWTRSGDTGWHDHDVSSGAVRVLCGAVEEMVLRIGGRPRSRVVGSAESFCFGPDHIHRLAGVEDGSVTLHAYSPPLWRLGQYTIDGDGVMRRVAVSYADELRPLEEAAAS
jgi:hypothetical protein